MGYVRVWEAPGLETSDVKGSGAFLSVKMILDYKKPRSTLHLTAKQNNNLCIQIDDEVLKPINIALHFIYD